MMAHRANGMDRKVMIFYLPVNDEPSSRPASIWLPEEKRREEMEDPYRENSHKSLLIPPYVSWFDFNTNWGAAPQITCNVVSSQSQQNNKRKPRRLFAKTINQAWVIHFEFRDLL